VANELQLDRRTILKFAFGATAVTLAGGAVDDVFAGQEETRPAPRTVRRIVTAHNAEGRSFIAVDDSVPMANIWRTESDHPIGTVPVDEQLLVGHATGETRFFLAAIPPSGDPKPNLENRVGFHRTGGIAYCYILNGELAFLVDTQEVVVRAGDLVVERNTMHSWRNEGTEPVTMAITVVTAVA